MLTQTEEDVGRLVVSPEFFRGDLSGDGDVLETEFPEPHLQEVGVFRDIIRPNQDEVGFGLIGSLVVIKNGEDIFLFLIFVSNF